MSAIRRPLSIEMIVSVQDEVSDIQVSANQRFLKVWYKGEKHLAMSAIK